MLEMKVSIFEAMVRPLLWRLVGDHPTGCCGAELWGLFTVCIRNIPHLRTAFRQQSCRAGPFAKTSVSCGPRMQVSSSFLLWLVQFLLSVVLAQTLMFLLSLFPSVLITTEFLYFLYFFFLLLKELKPHALGLCMFFINGTLLHFRRNPFIWRIGVDRSVFFQNNC